VDDPTQYGVLTVEGDVVTGVQEKPANPATNLVNAGVYSFPAETIDLLDVPESERGERELTDVLARGFVRGGRGLGVVRAGALLGLDSCSIVRDGLAAQTMGLLGGLPRVGNWHLERRP
jgi:hypothetical protein